MAARAETSITLRLLVLSVGLIGLVTAACAPAAGTHSGGTSPSQLVQAGPSASPGAAEPGQPAVTVTFGPVDAGKIITLEVGDTLVFSVSGVSRSMGRAWHLFSYPKALMRLISRSPTPPFRFRALHPGVGELRLGLGPTCGGPGPLAPSSKDCPVMDSSPSEGPPGFVSRLLTFPLRVLPRSG